MLLSNLNLLATAPGGVARLRELILTLAVQGKLLPQDANDEPASELLKKIRVEKDRLIAEGKIKRDKPLAEIAEEEKPFALPQGWEWVRLGSLLPFRIGKTPPSKDPQYWSDEGFAWVSISDMTHFGEVLDTNRKITAKGASVFGYEPLPVGTLIMSFKLTIGKIAVLRVPAYHNEAIVSLTPLAGLQTDFLKYMLPTVSKTGASKDALMGATLNTESLSNLLIALPPETEQSRIVTRVEELMRLCDALEAKAQLQSTQHAQLVSTLLGTLTASATPQELADNWQRVATHFDLLLDRPEAVDALEQTILGLALRGVLVAQDLNDEPSLEVVKRVAARRAQNRTKIGTPYSEEADAELPSLPSSWTWCNVEQIATVCLGGTPARQEPSYWNGTIPWVSSGEVANGRITDTREKITPAGLANSNAKVYPKFTVLIAMIGQGKTRGQSAILDIEAATNQNVAGLILEPEAANPDYMFLWALHEYVRTRSGGRGGAQPALNGAIIRSLKVPVPPLAEQSRIVTRVAQLRRLCLELRQRLTAAQSTQSHLAQALVQTCA